MTWQDHPERGSSGMIRFIVWLSLNTHRGAGRLLLYPICVYFFLFSSSSRSASRKYLTRVLGRTPRLKEIYYHYLTYARVILDRVFFLSGRSEGFDISISGHDVVDALREKGKGFIFLGAHQGSFDALRVLGWDQAQMPIKILMYPDNSQRLMEVVNGLNPALAQEIILLGRPNSMILAKQHLNEGGIIGILGDRITRGDKLVRSRFLGEAADFPAGPFLLASALKIPVVLFYSHCVGDGRYEVHFELLADEITLKSQTRQRDLQAWVDRYADRLDNFCRRAPYNWFNFYDFWHLPENSA